MRSKPRRTGVEGLVGREPFSLILPRRISSKAWEREQKPSLERARARPTLFEAPGEEGCGFFAGCMVTKESLTWIGMSRRREAGMKASATFENQKATMGAKSRGD